MHSAISLCAVGGAGHCGNYGGSLRCIRVLRGLDRLRRTGSGRCGRSCSGLRCGGCGWCAGICHVVSAATGKNSGRQHTAQRQDHIFFHGHYLLKSWETKAIICTCPIFRQEIVTTTGRLASTNQIVVILWILSLIFLIFACIM